MPNAKLRDTNGEKQNYMSQFCWRVLFANIKKVKDKVKVKVANFKMKDTRWFLDMV